MAGWVLYANFKNHSTQIQKSLCNLKGNQFGYEFKGILPPSENQGGTAGFK
jgi:hypothetical protein